MPRPMRLRDNTTVGEEWADYLNGILRPAGAGAIQIEECKRAFYAGAYVMFGIMTNVAGDAPNEETGAARIAMVEREALDYFTSFQKRHGTGETK